MTTTSFKATPTLIRKAKKAAKAEKKPLSEFIRSAVLEKLEREAPEKKSN